MVLFLPLFFSLSFSPLFFSREQTSPWYTENAARARICARVHVSRDLVRAVLCNANVAIPIIKPRPSSYSKFINELFSQRGITKTNARAIINVMGSQLEYLVTSTPLRRNREKRHTHVCVCVFACVRTRSVYVWNVCTRSWQNGNHHETYCCPTKFYLTCCNSPLRRILILFYRERAFARSMRGCTCTLRAINKKFRSG